MSRRIQLYKSEGTDVTYGQSAATLRGGISLTNGASSNSTTVVRGNPIGRNSAKSFENSSEEEKINILLSAYDPDLLNELKDESTEEVYSLLYAFSNNSDLVSGTKDVFNTAISLFNSSINTREQNAINIRDSIKSQSVLAYRSQKSEQIVYNTLQEPDVESKLVYNFFTPEEEDVYSQELEPTSEEDVVKQLREPARYVDLKWAFLRTPKEIDVSDSIKSQIDPRIKMALYRTSGTRRIENDLNNRLEASNKLELGNNSKTKVFEYINNNKSFINNFLLTTSPEGDDTSDRLLEIASGISIRTNYKEKIRKMSLTSNGLYEIFGKSNSTENFQEHEVRAISWALKDFQIDISDPSYVFSDPSLVGIDYIGYVIEKDRLIKTTGRWKRVANYYIFGALNNNFKDIKVAYGQVYRYKVKSVVKVTLPVRNESRLNSLKLSTSEVQKKGLTDAIVGNIKKVLNVDLDFVRKDENTRSTFLNGGYVVSSNDNKSSVSNSYSYSRNEAAKTSRNVAHSYNLEEIIKDYNLKLEKSIDLTYDYHSYYYESDPCKIWQHVPVYENVPPKPPRDIKIIPRSLDKKIRIIWLPPVENQRDISKVRLYRRFLNPREGENSGWNLIDEEFLRSENKQTNFLENSFSSSDNFFDDFDVDFGRVYIYALETEDVHGLTSFLSSQIGAELNDRFHIERSEKPLRFISGSGLKKEEINERAKVFRSVKDVYFARNKIKVKPSTYFNDTSKSFILKVKSLDTLEEKEVKITLNNQKINMADIAIYLQGGSRR